MKFYHFTSPGHVGHILAYGALAKGTIWTGEDAKGFFSAVLLTTDPDPDRSGVDDGRPLQIPIERRLPNGPIELRGCDKRRVRFTVTIPSSDRDLRNYWTFIQGRVGRWYLDYEIASTTGGLRSVRNWHFYRRAIPLSRIERIEIMDENDDYAIATPEALASLEPFEIGATFSDPDVALASFLKI